MNLKEDETTNMNVNNFECFFYNKILHFSWGKKGNLHLVENASEIDKKEDV
jgi:hypothetical protein